MNASRAFVAEDLRLCPDGLPDFVIPAVLERVVAHNRGLQKVITYTRESRGREGVCHECGNITSAPHIGGEYQRFYHAQNTRCQVCDTEVISVTEGNVNERWAIVAGVFSFAQLGGDGTLWIREFEVARDRYAQYTAESLRKQIMECTRYAFRGPNRGKWLYVVRSAYTAEGWKSILEWRKTKFAAHYTTTPWVANIFFAPESAEALAGTVLATANLAPYIGKTHIVDLLSLSMRYTAFEWLIKSGYTKIVKDICKAVNKSEYTEIVNHKAKRKSGVFTVGPEIMSLFPRGEWDVGKLRVACDAVNNAQITEPREVRAVVLLNATEKYIAIIQRNGLSFTVTYDYLVSQGYNDSVVGAFNIYIDYIKECEQLGYDLRDKRISRPRSLVAAHQATAAEVLRQRDKIQQRERAKARRGCAKYVKYLTRFSFEAHGVTARPCASEKEMRAEGAALHHCVGTYFERAARGDTSIFLVRRAGEPERPWYTAEVRNGELIQCRGLQNKSYADEPELSSFLTLWRKHITKQLKKELEENDRRADAGNKTDAA
ncbi:MAG: PcfJ domain-containing protein [Oscillospiraceae bacterium]|nr:PcfJ domain-containing protein [Oscillospiraceae bacterium]